MHHIHGRVECYIVCKCNWTLWQIALCFLELSSACLNENHRKYGVSRVLGRPMTGWFTCLLVLMLFCLFWTGIWNIQWRWSHYVRILCGLLISYDSHVCNMYFLFPSTHLIWFDLIWFIDDSEWPRISCFYSQRVFHTPPSTNDRMNCIICFSK